MNEEFALTDEQIQDYKKHLSEGKKAFENGFFEKALEHYDYALWYKPDSSEAWMRKGEALEKLDKIEEARKCFEWALSLVKQESFELERTKETLEAQKKELELFKAEIEKGKRHQTRKKSKTHPEGYY